MAVQTWWPGVYCTTRHRVVPGCSVGGMEVRPAHREDLVSIGRVAHAAVWTSCTGLLLPATISASLEHDYSPSSLQRRLLAGDLVVAVESPGRVVGFAEADIGDEHVSVKIHTAESDRRNPVRALLEAVRTRFPGRPVCADVLLGNLDGERSCEAAGFVPGEVIQRTLFGEHVVERRWWYSLPR